jgi:hypothetical protein
MPPDKSLVADYFILLGRGRRAIRSPPLGTDLGARLDDWPGSTFRFDIGSCHRLCSVD